MGKVVLVGFGVTLGALVIQALAGGLGAEAVGVLLTGRSVGASLWRNGLATIIANRKTEPGPRVQYFSGMYL
jgi:hypothetical protein